MKIKRILSILLLLLLFTNHSRAFAHANLENSLPHNGEVVSVAPDRVFLDFSEELESNMIELRMYDWNAQKIPLQGPYITPKHPSEMYAVLPQHLKEGSYTVVWNVVSQDGHPVTGSYVFSIGHVIIGSAIPQDSNLNTLQNLLVAIRYVVEGLVLLFSGFYAMTYFLRKREYVRLEKLLMYSKWILPFLLLGTCLEWFVYSGSLPGGDLTRELLTGQWNILIESRFALMLLIQFVLLVLLCIPQMIDAWYSFIWLLLSASYAFGGHAWAVPPIWFQIGVRILHLLSISIWMGNLTYMILMLYNKSKHESIADPKSLRSTMFWVLLLATTTIAGTGFLMVEDQAGLQVFTRGLATWSTLLWLKILLFIVMLILASIQTRRWKQAETVLSFSILRVEWTIGILIVLFGVWMSQIAYPIPIKSYTNELQAQHSRVEIQIDKLTIGNQILHIHLVDPKTAEPQDVHVQLNMNDMDMSFQPISARRTKTGSYQASIPFTMPGNWTISIDAEYQVGEHIQWSDTVFIPGGNS